MNTPLLITLLISTWATLVVEGTTIYEALISHGLPKGLFPKGVKLCNLDENGRFEVRLEKACDAKFESKLHYNQNVTGVLSYGMIQNLTGIEAQDLFLWFPVKGIRVDIPSTGIIYFDVGVVFKQFSASQFETPPDCVAASNPPVLKMGRPEFTGGLAKKLEGVLRYRFNHHNGKNAREDM